MPIYLKELLKQLMKWLSTKDNVKNKNLENKKTINKDLSFENNENKKNH